MMIKSGYAKKNFTKSVDTYDYVAKFQDKCAERLFNFARNKVDALNDTEKIFEIGCGTGFLCRRLIKEVSGTKLLVSDISEKMLERCRINTEDIRQNSNMKLCFDDFDASKDLPEEQFDLIISNLTFQWLEDLTEVSERLKKVLLPEGKLIFSTLTEKTFENLRTAFEELNLPCPMPDFSSQKQLKKEFETEFFEYSEEHEDIRAFLKHLQNTGAVNATGRVLRVSEMRKLMDYFDGGGPLKTTYHAALCCMSLK